MKSQKRDFISITDFTSQEIHDILLLARRLRATKSVLPLKGKTVGLVFQKPSTRTSVSFAVGVVQLGGHPLILNADVLQLKRGELPKDTGRVLSRYLNAIVMRASRHDDILELARHSSIPVINGLTDKEHPCQVIADLLTIMDAYKFKHPKQLKNIQITFLGDGNNMAHSLMLAAGLLGMNMTLSCPKNYQPKSDFMALSKKLALKSGGTIEINSDPQKGVKNADVLYTDVWTSMGQEEESQKRRRAFKAFQLNRKLLSAGKKNAIVMHCLPAHRGEEITEEVLEGKQSVVFDQAENRLHAQKAILTTLMKK